jgi:hypothetical protein
MSLDERIANLIETGALKEAARDGPLIRQYLLNAQEDADAAKSTIGRFLLAYDGLHALAMAFFTDRGLRTGGEGHRSTALQLAIGELTKDAPFAGAVSAIILIHKARNDTTYYKPLPPVPDALLAATLKLLDAALAGAAAQIQMSETGPRHPR